MSGLALVISAPSGTGKTTVARSLVESREDTVFSVSVTTRRARPDERPDVDYRFVSREEFAELVAGGELLEWAEVHSELYGTPMANRELAEREGKVLVLDIDVQGAREVKRRWPDAATVFLLPPSYQEWLQRLRGRASEDVRQLRVRLTTARRELGELEEFDYVIVHEDVPASVSLLDAIIRAERHRTDRQREAVGELRERIRVDLERDQG